TTHRPQTASWSKCLVETQVTTTGTTRQRWRRSAECGPGPRSAPASPNPLRSTPGCSSCRGVEASAIVCSAPAVGLVQPPDLFPGPVLARDEHVLARELLEQSWRLPKVGGQHVERVAGDPLRQVDRLVDAAVEPDEDAALLVADVLDRVPVPLRDVADVAPLQRLNPVPAVRTEHGHADVPLEAVLPPVGRRVPGELPH